MRGGPPSGEVSCLEGRLAPFAEPGEWDIVVTSADEGQGEDKSGL